MIAKEAAQERRGYLGMSGIGHDCLRKLWFDYRWCAAADSFSADTLRNFADGHYSEDLTAKRLQAVKNVQLYTHDRDGGQFGFYDLGGHFRGHLDGWIKLKHESNWRVWEHKCVNEKKFKALDTLKQCVGEEFALEQWDFIYYVQAQMYLHYGNAEEHYLTCATSGSRKYQSCKTGYDQTTAERMILRAESIIKAPKMLPGVSADPTFYQCNWCNHKTICYGDKCGEVSCRTCIHSEPIIDDSNNGFWKCAKHKITLTKDDQIRACGDHLLIPDLLATFAEQIGADDERVFYRHRTTNVEFANGFPDDKCYTSWELCETLDTAILGDEFTDQMRRDFNAELGK